jgi:hypothetical protein
VIWFACGKCGKRHKQPTAAAGSLIFCECGQAIRVPWESTVAVPGEGGERPRRSGSRRRREARQTDPAHCLNHEDSPSAHTCPDCGEAFCPRCLVELQGLRLCCPCKDFRVRRLQRAPQVTGLAAAALIVGVLSAPIIFCMTMVPATQGAGPGTIAGVAGVGVVIGLTALVLGVLALRQIEWRADRGGHGLAMTGAALGASGLAWSLSLAIVMATRLVQG